MPGAATNKNSAAGRGRKHFGSGEQARVSGFFIHLTPTGVMLVEKMAETIADSIILSA